MERCDFASIMQIIRGGFMEGAFSNQMELVQKLFSAFLDEGADDVFIDASQVNKWFNGLLKPSPSMTRFYATDEVNQAALADAFEDEILPFLSDPAMVTDQIYELLVQDPSVSETKKQDLIAQREITDSCFLAAVLTFGMSRPFVARDIRKPVKSQDSAKSPPVEDYFFDAAAPKPCRTFCGRDAELDALHAALAENDKVFLQGIPGIGKSEIAKAYAKNHKKDYTNILYFIYSGDLKRDIADLQFADDQEGEDEEKRFHRHNRFLRTLKKDSLLIIDNFNTTTTRDKLLSVILKYRCRILFTTKSSFSDHSQVTVEEISDHAVLFDLFSRIFKEAAQHRETVEAIMETVHYHTLSIELAARLAQSGLLTPQEILSKLQEERAAFSGEDEIKISKDGETVKATYYQHIYTLFALFRLDDPQSYAMRCMSMVPLSGIPARLFAKWVGFTDMNTVNDLTELGFVREDESRELSLHPMMQDVTIADLKPSVTNCQRMLGKIGVFCNTYGRDVPYARLIRQIVENTIRYMVKEDINWYVRFLEHVQASLPDSSCEPTPNAILDELEHLLSDETVGTAEDRAALLHFKALRQKSLERSIALLSEAVRIFPEPNSQNAHALFYIHSTLADTYRKARKLQHVEKHLKAARDLDIRFGGGNYDQHGELAMALANYYNDTERFTQARNILVPLEMRFRQINPMSFDHAASLHKLAVVTTNCGDPQRGLALLAESERIYETICADNEELLDFHKNHIIARIRKQILSAQKTPNKFVGGS